MSARTAALVSVLSFACSRAATPVAPQTPNATPVTSSAPAVTAVAAPAPPRERPELRSYFERERITGGLALLDTASGEISCSDVERCQASYLPASTFKIANTIIALETGIVEDAETVLPWDGAPRELEEWNAKLTLREAIRTSCVPCYQDIARKIGQARMNDWLVKLDYGNHDATGGIDAFWLGGGLRITPLEQLGFLRRLAEGKLPISERTREIVLDLITLDVGPEHQLLGKTGLVTQERGGRELGWFVGYVELGARRVYFATTVDSHAADVDLIPVRRRVTETALNGIGALPAK
jgi:beta-lactamase class D